MTHLRESHAQWIQGQEERDALHEHRDRVGAGGDEDNLLHVGEECVRRHFKRRFEHERRHEQGEHELGLDVLIRPDESTFHLQYTRS